MKLQAAIIAFLFFSVSTLSFGQKYSSKNIPQQVTQSFSEKYPDLYPYKWKYSKKKGTFYAKFINNGQKNKAYYRPDGQWIRTEKDIKRYQLPQTVLSGISKTPYALWHIDDVEEHETPEHNLLYVVEMEQGRKEVYLYLLPDGSLINTITKK